MNRRVLICGMCVILVCILAGAAMGEKPTTDGKRSATLDRKTEPAKTVPATKPEPAATSAAVPASSGDRLIAGDENQEIITPANDLLEQGADAYAVPWKSINGGGGTASTPTHRVSVSIGQTLIGYTSSPDHAAGIGYWYGIPTADGCDCGAVWGDMNGDASVNPVDVVYIINFVYRAQDDRPVLPSCPDQPGDVNCNGPVDAVDVVYYLNYVYKDQNAFCSDPCTP